MSSLENVFNELKCLFIFLPIYFWGSLQFQMQINPPDTYQKDTSTTHLNLYSKNIDI